MPTTAGGLPYPAATDDLRDGAAAIQALATALGGTPLVQTGTVDVAYGATSAATAPVTFPQAFAAPPIVVAGIASGSTSPRSLAAASAITATGFTAGLMTADGGNSGTTRTVAWVAVGVKVP